MLKFNKQRFGSDLWSQLIHKYRTKNFKRKSQNINIRIKTEYIFLIFKKVICAPYLVLCFKGVSEIMNPLDDIIIMAESFHFETEAVRGARART